MIPKRLIPQIMSKIREIEVEAPIELGDIILKNIMNTGADLVATRTVRRIK